jgi:hypothetical protein
MRAPYTYDFVRGPGYTVGAAMSKEGYLAVKVLPGAFDSFDFFDFIAEQVVCIHLSSCTPLTYISAARDERLACKTQCTGTRQLPNPS